MSDVFISYSRKDIAFARLIQKSLQESEIDTWIDWERIPVGERWWVEICTAIETANVFMFIISKNSIGSFVCKDEINHALKNHKRIIPILVDNLKPEEITSFVSDLPQFNWIIFQRNRIFRMEKNPKIVSDKPEDAVVALPQLPQFEEALKKLSQAIHTDWEWVKYHTRLQLDALRWEANERNPSFLVQGIALEEAERLLLGAGTKDPRPTPLQIEYVTASRHEENRRQQETLRLEQKARQRQRFVIWAIGIGLALATVLGVVAWNQRNQYLGETHVRATAEVNAINQRSTAEAASTLAVDQRNEAERQAKIALSGQLSAQSQTQLGYYLDLARLLAAESYLVDDSYNSRTSLLLALEQSPQLERIYRYSEVITALAFSPDGDQLAAGGCAERDEKQDVCLQNKITFYQLENAETQQILVAPKGRLTGLAFTPDGTVLYAAIAGDRLYRFNLSPSDQFIPIPLQVFDNSSAMVVISPDGKYMASGGCYMFSMPGGACDRGGLVLWDLSSSTPLGLPLTGVGTGMHNLAFSPQNDRLYAGDCAGSLNDRCAKGEVKIWTLPDGTMQEKNIENTTSAIVSVDVSADGKLLAAGEAAGVVHVINIATWKQVASHTHTQNLEIDSLLFSRMGSQQILTSLSFGSPLDVFSATNSRDEFTLEPYQTTRFVEAVAISPDGRLLASSSCAIAGEYQACKTGEIYVWNLFSWQPLSQIFGSNDASPWNYWQVGFDPSFPQKPIIIAASTDEIVLWDVDKNEPAEKPFLTAKDIDFTNISVNHSGNILVYADLIGYVAATGMHFWDVATRKLIATPVLVDGWILDLYFSPDDRWMISDGPENTFMIWDPTNGQIAHRITITVKPSDTKLAFSPDGKTMAITGCSLSDKNQPCQNYRIELFDLGTGKRTGTALDGQMRGKVNRLEFNADGSKIGINTSIDLVDTWWDIKSGQPDLLMNNLAVEWLRSPDGHYAVSADCEIGNNSGCGIGIITLRDVQKQATIGQPIRNPDQNLTILGFSPDSKHLYTFGVGKMTVWSLDPQDWLERVCRIANRNFTQEEWSLYVGQAPYQATCPLVP